MHKNFIECGGLCLGLATGDEFNNLLKSMSLMYGEKSEKDKQISL
jgi:hypothetical protein